MLTIKIYIFHPFFISFYSSSIWENRKKKGDLWSQAWWWNVIWAMGNRLLHEVKVSGFGMVVRFQIWFLPTVYSTGTKSSMICFALLLLQILVNFQNQGQIWNLLVLTFSKHPLHVQFDQVLAEILEVKDRWDKLGNFEMANVLIDQFSRY